MSRLVDHALATPAKYPLTEVHIKALAGLRPWLKKNVEEPSAALARWLDSVREQLEVDDGPEPPKEPADFRRAAPIKCACADCAELKRFLEDPHERVLRLKAGKDRRRHLHSQIDSNRIDLTHVTERRRLAPDPRLHQDHGVLPGQSEEVSRGSGTLEDDQGHPGEPAEMIRMQQTHDHP